MIKADVTIAEQRQIVDVPVETKSEAIRVLWNTYGLAIDINRWVGDEKQEEVEDEQVDSNESDDSGESSGEGD
ncbi:hypothetical protein GPZ88_01055 [Streptococcus ruminicola]|uniref:Uncharacterized protein n=1 Tax=Streptococcus ruminicola TaxID=2686210 RepID=A0A6G8HY72_9STRE|nr:hypothetical protein [Streptococcus ruminicola]QIM45728.1 hypothetical protein GPZ88_01055 [Streptococcus ruminicola]